MERTGAFLAAHGDRLYTALNDEGDSDFMTLAVYDISGVTPVMVDSERYAGRIADLQVSPDGRFLVTLGGDYGGVDQYATADPATWRSSTCAPMARCVGLHRHRHIRR